MDHAEYAALIQNLAQRRAELNTQLSLLQAEESAIRRFLRRETSRAVAQVSPMMRWGRAMILS